MPTTRAYPATCHLRYDTAFHVRNAHATRRQGKAMGELFDLPSSPSSTAVSHGSRS